MPVRNAGQRSRHKRHSLLKFCGVFDDEVSESKNLIPEVR